MVRSHEARRLLVLVRLQQKALRRKKGELERSTSDFWHGIDPPSQSERQLQ
jgi:hypothetical protein